VLISRWIVPDLNRDINSRGGNTERQILNRQKWQFDPFLRSQLPTTMPRIFTFNNKKHLKKVGPIRYCEPPLHCQSPGVASRMPAIAIAQAACDVHDIDNPRHRQRVTEGTAMAPWNGPNNQQIRIHRSSTQWTLKASNRGTRITYRKAHLLSPPLFPFF